MKPTHKICDKDGPVALLQQVGDPSIQEGKDDDRQEGEGVEEAEGGGGKAVHEGGGDVEVFFARHEADWTGGKQEVRSMKMHAWVLDSIMMFMILDSKNLQESITAARYRKPEEPWKHLQSLVATGFRV